VSIAGRRPQHGFSLLEVLVALAILAMSLGVLYQAAGGSVRNVQTVEHRMRAILLAQSLLQMYDRIPPGGGVEQGVSRAGFDWSLTALPYPAPGQANASASVTTEPWPLYRVEAAVFWRDGARQGEFRLARILPDRPPSPGVEP